MNKYKNSFLLTLTSVISNLLSAIFGLILIRLIISNIGSNYNGLNVTINQFVSAFILLEGGITVVFAFHLFKPLSSNEIHSVNKILSFSKKRYYKIGVVILLLAIPSSVLYSFIIKTDIYIIEIMMLFLLSILGIFINVSYTIKYRLILEATNNEYIIQTITIFITLIINILSIFTIIYLKSYFAIRFIYLCGQVLNYIILRVVVIKKFPKLSFKESSDDIKLNGSKDMYAERVIGSLYDSSYIFYSSIFLGTTFLSVYAIYNTIISTIRNMLISIVNGPRIYYGHLIAQKKIDKLKNDFTGFQSILNMLVYTIGFSLLLMITPFVIMYTKGVNDADYYNQVIPFVLIITMMIHTMCVPSSHIIILSGYFKESKIFQSSSFIVLIISIIMFTVFGENELAIISIFIAELILFVTRIYFAYIHVLKYKITFTLKIFIPGLIMSLLLYYNIKYFNFKTDNISSWLISGIIITFMFLALNLIVIIIFNSKKFNLMLRKVKK